MSGRPYTQAEIDILRPLAERWGSRGVRLALAQLPGRTYSGAYQLSVKSEWVDPKPRLELPTSDLIDAQIRKVYAGPVAKTGVVAELAERIGYPRWWISRRARQLGLVSVIRREPKWSDEELTILSNTTHMTPESAWRAFRRNGFKRTAAAIMVMRKRQRIGQTDAGYHTAGQLADLLGTDSKTVCNWIKHGKLVATRKGTNRTEVQGGDVWLISENALRDAVLDHPLMVNLRRLPASSQAWFIDVLGGARKPKSTESRAAA